MSKNCKVLSSPNSLISKNSPRFSPGLSNTVGCSIIFLLYLKLNSCNTQQAVYMKQFYTNTTIYNNHLSQPHPPPFLFSFLDRPNIYLFPHFPCFKLTSNNVRFYRDCIIRHYLTYVFSHLKVAVKKYQNHREVLRIGHANHN